MDFEEQYSWEKKWKLEWSKLLSKFQRMNSAELQVFLEFCSHKQNQCEQPYFTYVASMVLPSCSRSLR